MKSIQICNLRSLKDTGTIELKPITMLVGANSAGKSTFLRVFPLFKQGVKEEKQGPILWYGSEVDFGSYQEALRHGESEMKFKFSWNVLPLVRYYPFMDQHQIDDVTCEIIIKGDKEESFVSELHVVICHDQVIDIFYGDKTNVYVNNHLYTDLGFEDEVRIINRSVIPVVALTLPNEDSRFFWDFPSSIVEETLLKLPVFKKIRKGNMDNMMAPLRSKGETLKVVMDLLKIKRYNEQLLEDPLWQRYNNMCVLYNLRLILGSIDQVLASEFADVRYIKPFRASAERYYRKQNLALKTLESDGHNMAMYIYNMYKNKAIASSFKKWTKDNFSFELEPGESEGNVSLRIKDGNNKEYCNIADKGFGYSQILPVILTLWQIFVSANKNKGDNVSNTIFAVFEQPELHLHPKLQAKVMDAIIAVLKEANKNGIDLRFIIETHSPVMINRLGLRVAMNDGFDKDQVSVLLFDEDSEHISNPRVASYNQSGHLTNWPLGFFEPDL